MLQSIYVAQQFGSSRMVKRFILILVIVGPVIFGGGIVSSGTGMNSGLVEQVQAACSRSVYVYGYIRNGKYVKSHYRTCPDGNPYNNYSFPGNYNPNIGPD